MHSRIPRQTGFSLLEVLVAFSIMALSLGALYQILGGSVRGAMEADRRIHAMLAAESLLALYDGVPKEGIVANGVTADGMRWSVVSAPASAPVSVTANVEPPWRLHRVEVSVTWGGEHSRGVRLASLLPELADTQQ